MNSRIEIASCFKVNGEITKNKSATTDMRDAKYTVAFWLTQMPKECSIHI